METLSKFTDDRLADRIVAWAGRGGAVAAGETQLLELIGEYDRRQAWGGHGRLSCARVRAITRVATPDEQQRWVEHRKPTSHRHPSGGTNPRRTYALARRRARPSRRAPGATRSLGA